MSLYVETAVLIALLKPDDSLREGAKTALDGDESVYTSLLSAVERLVEAPEPGEGGDYDVRLVVANLLEIVPIRLAWDEDVALAAAIFLAEYEVTPVDAFQAGIAVRNDDRINASDPVYDELGLDRVPVEPDESSHSS